MAHINNEYGWCYRITESEIDVLSYAYLCIYGWSIHVNIPYILWFVGRYCMYNYMYQYMQIMCVKREFWDQKINQLIENIGDGHPTTIIYTCMMCMAVYHIYKDLECT